MNEQIIHNPVIDTLLDRRSIRAFKPGPLADDVVATLEHVAQQAPSSQYLNDWSAIRVNDPALKERLAQIGHQPYIATAPLLYVFVATSIAIQPSPPPRASTRPATRSRSTAATGSLRRRTTRSSPCMRWRPPPIRSAWAA